MNSHRLVMDRRIIERDRLHAKNVPPDQALRYQLFYQLSRITRDRGALVQDDRLDALAGAVRYWKDRLAQDADEAIADREAQQLEDMLKLAFNSDISTDGLCLGLNLEQAAQVNTGHRGKKPLDMV